ncbi:hypothetical protein ES705_41636 [subsurface metagenome]
MRKFLVILMVVAMASFLFVGCLPVTPPINTAPVITPIPDATVTAGNAFTYAVVAADPDVGDVLTYSLTVAPLTPAMVIDAATGAITWPITTEGTFGVIVVVTDEGGLSDFEGFTITVSAVEPGPEPELQLVGIIVDPKTMELYAGEIKEITSVTATYEVKGYETDIAPGDCIFLTSDLDVATVSKDGDVEAVAKGTATILVGYEGKFDTLEVTVERAITITWFEDSTRYDPEENIIGGSPWYATPLGPATLVEDDGGWCFADVNEVYNASGDAIEDFSGAVAISETGVFSGYTTYTSVVSELPIEENFLGQVEIIVYEDGTSGTMVGTYTQWSYAFTESDEDIVILDANYPGAVECVEDEGKWFIGHTDYITYPR